MLNEDVEGLFKEDAVFNFFQVPGVTCGRKFDEFEGIGGDAKDA